MATVYVSKVLHLARGCLVRVFGLLRRNIPLQLPLRYSVGLEVLNPPTELPPRSDRFFGCGYILCNLHSKGQTQSTA